MHPEAIDLLAALLSAKRLTKQELRNGIETAMKLAQGWDVESDTPPGFARLSVVIDVPDGTPTGDAASILAQWALAQVESETMLTKNNHAYTHFEVEEVDYDEMTPAHEADPDEMDTDLELDDEDEI